MRACESQRATAGHAEPFEALPLPRSAAQPRDAPLLPREAPSPAPCVNHAPDAIHSLPSALPSPPSRSSLVSLPFRSVWIPTARFERMPSVTSHRLHKQPAAPSASVPPGCVRAEPGTPTAAAHTSGNRPHGSASGSERGAKGHRTPRIPSNQRKSASFSLQRTRLPCRASSQLAVGWARTGC